MKSYDFRSREASLSDFESIYPSLDILTDSKKILMFSETWLEKIWDKRDLWVSEEQEINGKQKEKLIQQFIDVYQIDPNIIHSWVFKFYNEYKSKRNKQDYINQLESKIVSLASKNDELSLENQKSIEAIEYLSNELFTKINSTSKIDLLDYIRNNSNLEYSLPFSLTSASQEAKSRCSINSHRCNIFATNNENSFAIESSSNYGHIMLGWDQEGISEDSCRAVIHPYYTIVALCDGVSSKRSSGIYSSILSEIVANRIIYNKSNSFLFTGRGLIPRLMDSMDPTHPMLSQFLSSTLEEQIGGLNNAQSTLVQLIINRDGLVQFHNVGDSCIWKIYEDYNIEPISIDDNQEESLTDHVSDIQSNVHQGFVKLKYGESIFACSDQVGSWIRQNNEINLAEWIKQLKKCDNLSEKNNHFLEYISGEVPEDDHQTWCLYTHNSEEDSHEEDTIIDNEEYIILNSVNYKMFKHPKPYFFNEETNKGIKRLSSESVYSNLKYIQQNFNLDWLLSYDLKKAVSQGKEVFLAEMNHLTLEDGFTDLGDIQWSNYEDEDVKKLLPKMVSLLDELCKKIDSSNVTHRDISLNNMFYDSNNDCLVMIDHNSVYAHGAFTGITGHDGTGYDEETGNKPCYGRMDKKIRPNIFHETSHRFPIKLLKISFELLNKTTDKQSFDNLNIMSDDFLIFRTDEIYDLFIGKQKPAFSQRIDEIVSRICRFTNCDYNEIEQLLSQLTYPRVYEWNSKHSQLVSQEP